MECNNSIQKTPVLSHSPKNKSGLETTKHQCKRQSLLNQTHLLVNIAGYSRSGISVSPWLILVGHPKCYFNRLNIGQLFKHRKAKVLEDILMSRETILGKTRTSENECSFLLKTGGVHRIKKLMHF